MWYYREPTAEPHPIVTQVLEAITDAKLPISLSTEPDFSTVVGADGSVRAR